MNRRELMAAVAVVAGLAVPVAGTTIVAPAFAHHKEGHVVGVAQGYIKSGNPKASGGPDNPGVGNPHNPY